MSQHAAVCSECEWIRRFPRAETAGDTAVSTAAWAHTHDTGHRVLITELIEAPGGPTSFYLVETTRKS